MERGEVQANGGITWASIKGTMTALLAEHKINLIVQYGLKPHPELPQVPLALNYAKTQEQRNSLLLLFATQEFGRPYLAPPGTPVPIAAILRESFMATMHDPEFLEEAHRRGLDIDPTRGEEIDTLVRQLYATASAHGASGARYLRRPEEMIVQAYVVSGEAQMNISSPRWHAAARRRWHSSPPWP